MNRGIQAKGESKLLEFLIATFPEIKRTRLKQYLKHGCVSINSRVSTQFDQPIKPGDEVRVETSKTRAVTPALQFHIQIVYEDEDIILINKPAGLLTIATEKIQRETAIFAVNDYLNKKVQAAAGRGSVRRQKRVFVVHRLDRDVSGLLLFAKDERVKFTLQENWDKSTKEYDAIVEGCPDKPSGTISSYLAENKILKVYSSSRPMSPHARKAITHYEVIRRPLTPPLSPSGRGQGEGKAPYEFSEKSCKLGMTYSHLKIRLETGRKHQIRVHLAELGCPVAGDKLYGAKTDPAGCIALHASRLAFQHPVSNKELSFTSTMPFSLTSVISATEGRRNPEISRRFAPRND